MKCDKCFKGIIRSKQDDAGIECKWCGGSGETDNINELKINPNKLSSKPDNE